ncbi:unnamed protein product [Linum tenue]|uniref:Uncharacterized protein n=1 Tax=Linum tenue TaxID=586396 RepID=A0AAV0IPW8_9ROSI|nr:unnamed protein product [Linum tenue]
MASSESLVIVFFFLLQLIVTTGPPLFFSKALAITMAPPPPENVTFGNRRTSSAVFAFGDSILDTGNNDHIATLIKSNFPPYGRDFPGRIPTGRFSDGRLISDFIVENLGIKHFLPPYLDPSLQAEDLTMGVCFASASSGYDPKTLKILSVLSVPDQLNLFRQYVGKLRSLVGEKRSNDVVKNGLYVISSGNNDVLLTSLFHSTRKSSSEMATYAAFLAGQASAFLRQLYGLGARKIVHLSALTTGCSPAFRTLLGGVQRQCSDECNELAVMFNEKLGHEIQRLNDDVSLPDLSVQFVDVYTPLLDIIRRPENYGFVVTKEGCCGTGTIEFGFLCNRLSPSTCADTSKYIFWNGLHPTEKAYKILTSVIMKDIKKLLY